MILESSKWRYKASAFSSTFRVIVCLSACGSFSASWTLRLNCSQEPPALSSHCFGVLAQREPLKYRMSSDASLILGCGSSMESKRACTEQASSHMVLVQANLEMIHDPGGWCNWIAGN